MARIKQRNDTAYGAKRGKVCVAVGYSSGINLVAQRFRTDPAFRNDVINGRYRYANGAFIPTSNNLEAAIIVGSAHIGGNTRTAGVLPAGVSSPIRKKYGRYGVNGRFGYGYGYPRSRVHRYAPKPQRKKAPHGIDPRVKKRPIILTPGAASSGAAEELLQLIANKNFGDSLKAAMDYLNVGIWELSIESHIDDKKIKRLRNMQNGRPYPEDVLALVIGLHLPPPVGLAFFEKAKIHLGYYDHEDVIYHMILGSMSTASVDEVNVELRNAGLPTIPRKTKTSVWAKIE